MRILLTIVFFFSAVAVAGELEFVPMASFHVKVSTPNESSTVWNKIRVYLLSNRYKFFKDQSANSKIYSYHDANEKITMLITDNHKKGFVEVVFFQDRKGGFGELAGNEFIALKSGIKQSLAGFEIVDGVSYVPGKKSN